MTLFLHVSAYSCHLEGGEVAAHFRGVQIVINIKDWTL